MANPKRLGPVMFPFGISWAELFQSFAQRRDHFARGTLLKFPPGELTGAALVRLQEAQETFHWLVFDLRLFQEGSIGMRDAPDAATLMIPTRVPLGKVHVLKNLGVKVGDVEGTIRTQGHGYRPKKRIVASQQMSVGFDLIDGLLRFQGVPGGASFPNAMIDEKAALNLLRKVQVANFCTAGTFLRRFRAAFSSIIACSYNSSPKALAIAMEAATHPMDSGLEHALEQTLGFLSGRPVPNSAPGPGFTQLVSRLERGENAKEAIMALHRIPAETWPTDQVNSLAQNLLSYLKNLPVDQRFGQDGLEALSLGQAAAGRLPEELAQSLRTALRHYGTPFHIVRTLPARMQYDREEIKVTAGEPIRLLFENNDTMPHNMVLVAVGAREKVGRAAEEMATEPGAWEKGYIPDSSKILEATRLLMPGESELLTFNVPSKPGKYEFVCTFPGHWRTMYGVLSVSPR